MLSSADGAGDAARCRQIGIAGYLTKPIKASELLNMTVTLLHGKTVASWKPPPSSANAQRAATPLRILLAEDNLVNQKLTLSLLRKEGHHVRLAENGQEALDRLEEETFDLVLMDVQMPVMDGFEAAGAIRERERKNGGHIPIVAMTANAMRGDQERCLDAGMDEYLAKPIDPDRLRRTLNEWRWKLRRTSPDAPGARLDGVERSDESAGTGSDEAPVNTAQALLRADNDRVRMCEMLSASAQDMARLMTDLRSAAGARDAQAVAASAHKLKKAAAAVSAEPATRLAQQVATLSTSGDLERVESLLNEFQRQVDLLVAFVGSMRDG
jgi:two-component system sensor histidine kinase/response regulator